MIDLEACNDTELYQLCRLAQIPVVPGLPRGTYINFLMGLEESPNWTEADHPIDSWRHGIINFVFEHWDRLEPQLTCPLRTKDPRACFGCIDIQAITCVTRVPQYENAIRGHRPKRG